MHQLLDPAQCTTICIVDAFQHPASRHYMRKARGLMRRGNHRRLQETGEHRCSTQAKGRTSGHYGSSAQRGTLLITATDNKRGAGRQAGSGLPGSADFPGTRRRRPQAGELCGGEAGRFQQCRIPAERVYIEQPY